MKKILGMKLLSLILAGVVAAGSIGAGGYVIYGYESLPKEVAEAQVIEDPGPEPEEEAEEEPVEEEEIEEEEETCCQAILPANDQSAQQDRDMHRKKHLSDQRNLPDKKRKNYTNGKKHCRQCQFFRSSLYHISILSLLFSLLYR